MSAPGSIVTYTLGITPVDPIHYELPFERFFKSYEVNRAIREVWSQARVVTGAEDTTRR